MQQMVYAQGRAVFLTYQQHAWVFSLGRLETKAAEVITMVGQGTDQGTGTQQKTVSKPLIIHPSCCTDGRWFTVARQLQVVPKHPKKQLLMDVSR